jgi:hypothetical protein
MIEHARRHGHFDPRYPIRSAPQPDRATADALAGSAPQDWEGEGGAQMFLPRDDAKRGVSG